MLGKREKRNDEMLIWGGASSVVNAIIQLMRNITSSLNYRGSERFSCGSHTENDTPQLYTDILSTTGHDKGRFVWTLPWPEEYSKTEDVEVFKTGAARLGTDGQDVGA
ncbi:hypothetical protein BPAE_0171g00160 [Botrytis paeoniae]|uniref:Uncharacterized protein n=1 Tax=Botrytis paeoniae TaxID=278948 RepID=A0A4Z1FL13_9HELO|nr:hypothetical protein BPAE_0171g00160 [Botrytis paeoniae]